MINPYLFFNGNAREALAFYEKVFNVENVGIFTFGDVPSDIDVNPEWIMDTGFPLYQNMIMMSDNPMGNYVAGNNINLTVSLDDATEVERLFDEFVAAGSEVDMPLEATFYSPLTGSVIDPYGIGWMFVTNSEED